MLYKEKIGIVTPYYKESRAILQRAIDSVKSLDHCGYEVVHYLIADGYPQELNDQSLVHIKLPKSHADYGDTPRIIGASLAIRDNCYGLMFLDADNILYPEHLALALQAHQEFNVNLILARRLMLREDGSVIPYEEDLYHEINHVDTGCYIFFGERIYDVLEWAKIPNCFSVIGDRYFLRLLKSKASVDVAIINKPTVGYTCLWKDVYQGAGELPPKNSKTLNFTEYNFFLNSLTASEIDILNKRLSNSFK